MQTDREKFLKSIEKKAKTEKSKNLHVNIPENLTNKQVLDVFEEIGRKIGTYVSHIGKYSRTKFPNSLHVHFKRDPKEKGCLDATFLEVHSVLWFIIRNHEPAWVLKTAKTFKAEIEKYKWER